MSQLPDWARPGQTVMAMGPNDDYVGRIVGFPAPNRVELEDASWVAESGRLHVFVRDGKADGMEIEPIGSCIVQWNDLIKWPHKLFAEAV